VDNHPRRTPVIAIIANADRDVVFAARDCGVNVVRCRSRPRSCSKVMDARADAPASLEGYVGPDRRRFARRNIWRKRRIWRG
jgi:hypothetical protein